MAKNPCGICLRGVRTGGIMCRNCEKWIHLNCTNLTYSAAKNLSEEDLKKWRCSSCSLTIAQPVSCSSLAQELDSAILKENENLKQELYEVKNKSSLFELQLEDDLKQKEEELEAIKKLLKARECELEDKIKALETRLKKEKEINEVIITQAEEEKLAYQKNNMATMPHCKECSIRREETKNMLSSIRTLETVIEILKKENDELTQNNEKSKPNCVTCFPPLIHCKKMKMKNSAKPMSNWKEATNKKKTSKTKITTSTPAITLKNRFEVFSDCSSGEDEVEGSEEEEAGSSEDREEEESVKKKNPKQLKGTRSRGKKQENNIIQERRCNKSKILLCTDSHGRDLSFHINNISDRFDAVSFVKPGGWAKQILMEHNINGEQLKERDVLVIMAGSNDVAKNEAQSALFEIAETIKKYQDKNIIVVDIPMRHDLVDWSCVNLEIRKTNIALKKLSEQYSNVYLVEASSAVRYLHTRHGQHFNKIGKHWLAKKIYEAAVTTSVDEERAPSSECMERLPEATAVDEVSIHVEEPSLAAPGTNEEEERTSALQGNDEQPTIPAIPA